jgi:hypothetical protein
MISLERGREVVDRRTVEKNRLDLVDDILMIKAGQGVEKEPRETPARASISTPPWKTVV